jgi:N-acetyl-anhydromuramyl-L-alanine amidase AmpD
MAKRTKVSPPKHSKYHVINRSSRHGFPIQAIAVHSTESQDLKGTTDDLRGVRSWFNNPRSDASSHIGIDGDGNTELWVPSTEKAWTILQLNPVTLNIEFIGRAAQPKKEWEEAQLKAGARWIAYWGIRFGIPTQRGEVGVRHGQPYIKKKGIIRHSDLTKAGFGSHTDPGKNFPLDRLLDLARYYRKNGWTTT